MDVVFEENNGEPHETIGFTFHCAARVSSFTFRPTVAKLISLANLKPFKPETL